MRRIRLRLVLSALALVVVLGSAFPAVFHDEYRADGTTFRRNRLTGDVHSLNGYAPHYCLSGPPRSVFGD